MPNTHCLPNGSLGTAEIPVSNISVPYLAVVDPGAGNRRGVVVWITGLNVFLTTSYAPAIINGGGTGTYNRVGDFQSAVTTDGWIFIIAQVPEAFVPIAGSQAIYNDVSNDTGHGSRFVANIYHWWDHIVSYIATTYGPNRPIVVSGASMGGIKSLQVLINRQSSIVGCIAHEPATLMECIPSSFTLTTLPFYNLNNTGLDLATNALTAASPAITVPTIIGYGTNDFVVGYGATTVSSGGGTDVSTFVGSQTLNITDGTKIIAGPLVKLTGLSGGTGTAILTFSAVSGNTLINCTTVSGSGSLVNGAPVVQSNTDAIITNAVNASLPVTRSQDGGMATPITHEFTGTPSGAGNNAATYAAWIASNIDPTHPISF